VPITSTYALTNATLPYVLSLADNGLEGALAEDPGLWPGVNVAGGSVTHAAVAQGVGMEYVPVAEALGLPAPEGNGSVEGTRTDKQHTATSMETKE